MMIIKSVIALAAAGLLAGGAAAQTTNSTTTTTKASTKVHVSKASPTTTSTKVQVSKASSTGVHHGRRLARGHHRTCHTVIRHGHNVRTCSARTIHSSRQTTIHAKVTTKTN